MNTVKKDNFERSRKIIGVDEVETVVVDFVPQEFPIIVTKQADDFFRRSSGASTEFKISELVSKQVGINALEKEKIEERIESEILLRMKDVEERAYKKAYDLGFQEGTENALEEKKGEINASLESLSETVSSIQDYNKDLLAKKESQILNLIHHVAERIALFEIKNQPNQLPQIIENLFSGIQSEERVVIKLSKSDYENFEQLKKNSDISFDFLENSKLDMDESITSGGCRLVSNYGQINATVEQRVEKVWSVIQENLPNDLGLSEKLKEEELKSSANEEKAESEVNTESEPKLPKKGKTDGEGTE